MCSNRDTIRTRPSSPVATPAACDYLASPELRHEIHDRLQVVENWNSGNGVIFYGKDGDPTGPDRESAEVSMLALHLLHAAVSLTIRSAETVVSMTRGSVGTVEPMLPAYREYRSPVGLEPVVACLWEQEPAHDRVQRVVPDGCVDVLWFAEHSLVMAGADTGPRSVELPAGVRTSGIRLRPGAAGAVLGFPASELCDRQVDASLVWGHEAVRLREAMAEATQVQRLRLLADMIARHNVEPDVLVAAAAHRLATPGARVAGVAAELGVSERQLHRRTLAAVGYGPKMLARVARLRRLIVLGCEDGLAQRALAAGYASQTHLNEEVRRLTGATPVRFLKDAALTAA